MNVSIVLLDKSASAAEDLFCELSGQGMLHTFLVVRSSGEAAQVAGGVSKPVDLHAYLADRAVTLVRLLHLSLDGRPIADDFMRLVQRLEETLAPVGIRFERASVVAPLEGQRVAAAAFPQYWNYNLLVQPVDMAGEAGFAVLPLTSPAKQLAVATAFVCLCGALWRWLSEGPLDGGRFRVGGAGAAANNDADVNSARVRVARATTRMVDAGDIAAQAVALAMSPGVQFPPPPNCVRHGEPQSAVMQIVAEIFPSDRDSSFGFAYRALPPLSAPDKVRLGPLAAIKRFLTEFWAQIKRSGADAVQRRWEQIKATVEGLVAAGTFGADSNIKVSFSNAPNSEMALRTGRRVEAVSGLPNLEILTPGPSPSTWQGLIHVALAAADGGDMPAGFGVNSPKWENNRAVISEFGEIVHPALAGADRGRFVISKDDLTSIGWDDTEPVELDGYDIFAARTILSSLLKAKEEPVVSVAADEAAPAASPEESKKEPPKPQVSKSASKLHENLTRWTTERERTLVGKVAAGLLHQQGKALDELSSTSEALERVLEEMNDFESRDRKSRRRFLRSAILLLLLLLLVVGGAAVGVLVVTAVSALLWVGLGLLGITGVLWGMTKTARRRVRDLHRRNELMGLPQHLMRARQNAANEYVRLAYLYMQLQDWAEVLSLSLHRPLGDVRHKGESPWATTVGALSFVSGVPTLDQDKVRATTLTVLQHLATKSWLTRAFERQRAAILADYRLIASGIAAASAEPEADNSVDQAVLARVPRFGGEGELTVYPPRSNLRQEYAGGRWAAEYRAEQVALMQDAVAANDPFGMIKSVSCDVVGLNDPKRSPKEFLNPIVEWTGVPSFTNMFSPQLQISGVPVGSVLGASEGLGAAFISAHLLQVPVESLPDRFTLAAFRLDVSDAVGIHDMALIDATQNTPSFPPPVTPPVDPEDEPRFG